MLLAATHPFEVAMKTSKAQQEETRTRILATAVALMSQQGYDAVTMKDIARAAGIGDATVYKYFATKERLVLGYFDLAAQRAVADAQASAGWFDDYDLHARLQRLTDALLERLAPDRAFVEIARALLQKSPLLLLGDQLQARELFRDEVQGYLQAAVDAGELPASDFLRPLAGLYVDFCYGVVAYWLHDESAEGADTTRLVDQVLGVLVALLKAGVPDRLVQLGGFLLRSQLATLFTASGAAAPRRAWTDRTLRERASGADGGPKASSAVGD